MTAISRKLLPSPGKLVTNGRFNLGTYKEAFREINPLDAKIGAFIPYPKILKNLRLKEWQHFALANEDYYISLALFDAKTLALAQVCLYENKTGKIIFYEQKTLSPKIILPQALWNGVAKYNSKGFEIIIDNVLKKGFHKIHFDIAATKDLPPLKGTFTCFEDLNTAEPIVVCLPLHAGRAMYSHKFICPIEGTLFVADQGSSFSPSNSFGLIDIHKGYYPFVMKWHWATGGGYDADGRLTGLNLTDNQVKDQDAFNENCLWIDGRIHLLPPVKFTFNSKDLYHPWMIRDQHGRVDLTFTPEVIRTVDINALIMRSRYRGPFGKFSGRLRTVEGQIVTVDHHFGMCEDFYLRA